MIQGRLFPDEPRRHLCGHIDELAEGKGHSVEVDGMIIALFLADGRVEAIEGRCPHAGAPLARGWLEGATLVCPLHRWKFDVRTGQCLTAPTKPVRHFPVIVDASGDIWVDLSDSVHDTDDSE